MTAFLSISRPHPVILVCYLIKIWRSYKQILFLRVLSWIYIFWYCFLCKFSRPYPKYLFIYRHAHWVNLVQGAFRWLDEIIRSPLAWLIEYIFYYYHVLWSTTNDKPSSIFLPHRLPVSISILLFANIGSCG